MAKYKKPDDPNVIWASEARQGDIEKPENSKVLTGWIKEKPPFETENWLMHKLSSVYAYFNQLGIPEWDKVTEYQAGKSYVQGTDGIIYKCLVTNFGYDPAGSNSGNRWTIAFLERAATTQYTRRLLSSVTVEQAQKVLDLGSASNEPDDKYAHRSNNLSDIENKRNSFNNIKQQATTTYTGVVELATEDEVIEGERHDVVVTPNTLGGMNPSGTIIQFAGSKVPRGYLECDGRSLNRIVYKNLFDAISTTYGSGNGTTTFNIPDLRGQFIRGWDHERGIDQNRTLGSTQDHQIHSHSHSGNTNSAGNHSHTGSAQSAGSHTHTANSSSAGYHSHTGSTNNAGYHSHTGSTNSAGSHTHTGSTHNSGSHAHPIDTYLEHDRGGAAYVTRSGQERGGLRHSTTLSSGNHSHGLTVQSSGAHSHGLTVQSSGAHSHALSIEGAGNHAHSITVKDGGSHTHAVSISSAGNHSHNLSINSGGAHTHNITVNSSGAHAHTLDISNSGAHSHAFTTGSAGGNETRPVNVALMFCIKT